MKAILNEQCCSGFSERIKPAKTTEEAWAIEEAHHATKESRHCFCKLLDTDKGDAIVARWGTGVYVIEDGVPSCIAYNYDSSD